MNSLNVEMYDELTKDNKKLLDKNDFDKVIVSAITTETVKTKE